MAITPAGIQLRNRFVGALRGFDSSVPRWFEHLIAAPVPNAPGVLSLNLAGLSSLASVFRRWFTWGRLALARQGQS